MRTVYLIGTCHKYQFGPIPFGDTKDIEFTEFREALRNAIQRYDVRGVGEELCLETLGKWKRHWPCGDSVACSLALEMGLPHRYCDPDDATRKMERIVRPNDKEPYWIAQLRVIDRFPTLFILGADHVVRFERLLAASGMQPSVVVRDWKPSTNSLGAC
jgi:hypothetical protein